MRAGLRARPLAFAGRLYVHRPRAGSWLARASADMDLMLTRPRLSDQRGFTFIELLVTMTIVTIGLGGVLTLVDGMNLRSVVTQERQAGDGARARGDRGRALGLLPEAHAGDARGRAAGPAGPRRLVGRPGLDGPPPQPTYTITTQVCTVDDPKDGLGEHCAWAATATTRERARPTATPTTTGGSSVKAQLRARRRHRDPWSRPRSSPTRPTPPARASHASTRRRTPPRSPPTSPP